jgi:hypothetical protein
MWIAMNGLVKRQDQFSHQQIESAGEMLAHLMTFPASAQQSQLRLRR